jgi:hypothetical protein
VRYHLVTVTVIVRQIGDNFIRHKEVHNELTGSQKCGLALMIRFLVGH